MFVNLETNLRCSKAIRNDYIKKVSTLLLGELRHAAVLIQSGKLFQNEGPMTEKGQFPQESRLSSETTNSLLVEWSVQGVLLIKESASETLLTGDVSLVCFFSFYYGLGIFTDHLIGQLLPQEKSLGKLVVRLIVACQKSISRALYQDMCLT